MTSVKPLTFLPSLRLLTKNSPRLRLPPNDQPKKLTRAMMAFGLVSNTACSPASLVCEYTPCGLGISSSEYSPSCVPSKTASVERWMNFTLRFAQEVANSAGKLVLRIFAWSGCRSHSSKFASAAQLITHSGWIESSVASNALLLKKLVLVTGNGADCSLP